MNNYPRYRRIDEDPGAEESKSMNRRSIEFKQTFSNEENLQTDHGAEYIMIDGVDREMFENRNPQFVQVSDQSDR